MNHRWIRNVVISPAAILLLAACAGTPFKWDAARQIQTGMSEQEVAAIMGAPYLVRSAGTDITWVWSYADAFSGSRTVAVTFQNGRVTAPPPIPTSFQ